jgi:hypothetical protein
VAHQVLLATQVLMVRLVPLAVMAEQLYLETFLQQAVQEAAVVVEVLSLMQPRVAMEIPSEAGVVQAVAAEAVTHQAAVVTRVLLEQVMQ